jgi:hypothetical protein
LAGTPLGGLGSETLDGHGDGETGCVVRTFAAHDLIGRQRQPARLGPFLQLGLRVLDRWKKARAASRPPSTYKAAISASQASPSTVSFSRAPILLALGAIRKAALSPTRRATRAQAW